MRFHLDDVQEQFRDALSRFTSEACDSGFRRAYWEADYSNAEAFWRGLCELGVCGCLVPEEFGGFGLGVIDVALAAEVLGHAGAPGPFLGQQLCIAAVLHCGTEKQKHAWLPALAEGRALGTVAFSRDGSGWHPNSWTTVVHNGRISGTFTNVIGAQGADLVAIGLQGGGLAIVETGAEGVTLRALDCVDRTRPVWDLVLSHVPATPLEQPSGGAVFDIARILIAADACGGANRLLEILIEYVQIREQYGRLLCSYQAIRHLLADMVVVTEPLRPLYWLAACATDAMPDQAVRISALTKAHAAEIFMQVGRNVVEGHGGIGYTWDYDAQIWLKRAMFNYTYLGTPDRHRAEAAALMQ
ncbi:MAG: acyl-CoA/acyl-ACP dehydrogenase [Rhodobacter sp.]|nr:acyl-CoA/acyl-ACP dehydrogenase [Rhodobacter sp.]